MQMQKKKKKKTPRRDSNPREQSYTAWETPSLTIWPRFCVHSLCGFCFDKSIFDTISTTKVKLKKQKELTIHLLLLYLLVFELCL